jgi:type II secretory pathway pseudopilin PulG
MTKKSERQEGFTLVELSMSLVFIAFIILFLTSTMLSIMRTYNKGIWLNQINQAGRQVNADISDQARFSKSKITIVNSNQRLCIGGVAYIWNVSGTNQNTFSPATTEPLRFVRVLDGAGEYCSNVELMPNRNSASVSSMLGSGVIIQKFDVAESANTGLVHIHAVFSTEGDVQPKANASGQYECGQTIGGIFRAGNNQFCAFAEFDIITYRRLGE